jgi:glycosyltransferase involved in cell wall biosynthesis
MPARSILIVTLFAPPSHSSAARRPAGFAKYLARLGHRVTVISSIVGGTGAIPGATRVARSRDLLDTSLNWRRRNVQALTTTGASVAVTRPSVLERWAVPDVQLVSWLPFAMPLALRLARQQEVDCVITSSPTNSTHLIGAALQARGVPWIADLRDGWRFERSADQPFALPVLEALDARLERALLGRADARVGITGPIADDLRARFGDPTLHLPHAYDPDEMAAADALADQGPGGLLDGARHSLVYTGSIVGNGAAPFTLLDALHRLRAERDDATRLELVIAGPVRSDVREALEAWGLSDMVRLVGSLGRTDALALQRAADSLLVLVPERRPSVVTNKLIEYLVAGRPMLVLGAGSEAGRIAAERGRALVVPPGDVDATVRALGRLLDGDVPAGRPDTDRRDFGYPAVAERLSALIDDVIRG